MTRKEVKRLYDAYLKRCSDAAEAEGQRDRPCGFLYQEKADIERRIAFCEWREGLYALWKENGEEISTEEPGVSDPEEAWILQDEFSLRRENERIREAIGDEPRAAWFEDFWDLWRRSPCHAMGLGQLVGESVYARTVADFREIVAPNRDLDAGAIREFVSRVREVESCRAAMKPENYVAEHHVAERFQRILDLQRANTSNPTELARQWAFAEWRDFGPHVAAERLRREWEAQGPVAKQWRERGFSGFGLNQQKLSGVLLVLKRFEEYQAARRDAWNRFVSFLHRGTAVQPESDGAREPTLKFGALLAARDERVMVLARLERYGLLSENDSEFFKERVLPELGEPLSRRVRKQLRGQVTQNERFLALEMWLLDNRPVIERYKLQWADVDEAAQSVGLDLPDNLAQWRSDRKLRIKVRAGTGTAIYATEIAIGSSLLGPAPAFMENARERSVFE